MYLNGIADVMVSVQARNEEGRRLDHRPSKIIRLSAKQPIFKIKRKTGRYVEVQINNKGLYTRMNP